MKKKILVVEDFTSVRDFVCETLQRKGYETMGASNGTEAYNILLEAEGAIHLVLTDYHMPDGTGYDLLKLIKGDQRTASVPVIFLTSESNPEKIQSAKEMGNAGWIKKPYRAENFFAQIHRTIFG